MMKRILLSGVALAAMSTFAAAQTTPSHPAAPGASSPTMGGPASPGVSNPAPKKDANAPLFTNYKGADVAGPDGKTIASISDVIIDGQGKVQELALSYGGLLGIGSTEKTDKVTALPPLQDGKVKLDLTEASLKSLPKYVEPGSKDSSEAEGRASTSGSAAPAPAPNSAATSAPAPSSSSMAAKSDASGDNMASTKPEAGATGAAATGNSSADKNLNLSTNKKPGEAPAANGATSAPDATANANAMPADTSMAAGEMWPVSNIVGATLHKGDKTASISDAMFDNGSLSEVVISDGTDVGLGKGEQRIAFNKLSFGGTPADPKIMLNDTAGAAAPDSGAAAPSAPSGAPSAAPQGGAAPAPGH